MRARLSILALYNWDNDIFEWLNLPDGVNKEVVVNTILTECAELECMYPNPDTVKAMIKYWSMTKLNSWSRMYRALTENYNPLHNYDRYEQWEEAAENEASGSSQHDVAGYNIDPGMTEAYGDSQSTEGSASSSREGHAYGNIGVVTSADMIRGEIAVRTRFNIYDIILESFKDKFCVLVY